MCLDGEREGGHGRGEWNGDLLRQDLQELNINPKLATASPEIGKEMDGWVDGGLGAGKIKPETRDFR